MSKIFAKEAVTPRRSPVPPLESVPKKVLAKKKSIDAFYWVVIGFVAAVVLFKLVWLVSFVTKNNVPDDGSLTESQRRQLIIDTTAPESTPYLSAEEAKVLIEKTTPKSAN